MDKDKLKEILDKHVRWLNDWGFRDPKLFAGRYWIDKDGSVASIINSNLAPRSIPKILKPRFGSNGYRQIKLMGKNKLLHRVVAELFIGSVEGKIVHHKNGIRDDNRIENLEVTTYSKNNRDGRRTKNKMYGKFIDMCIEHAARIKD